VVANAILIEADFDGHAQIRMVPDFDMVGGAIPDRRGRHQNLRGQIVVSTVDPQRTFRNRECKDEACDHKGRILENSLHGAARQSSNYSGSKADLSERSNVPPYPDKPNFLITRSFVGMPTMCFNVVDGPFSP